VRCFAEQDDPPVGKAHRMSCERIEIVEGLGGFGDNSA
jgi:hypothetical protein